MLTINPSHEAAYAWVAERTGQTSEAVTQQAIDDAGKQWQTQMDAASEQAWLAKRTAYDKADPKTTKEQIEAAVSADAAGEVKR